MQYLRKLLKRIQDNQQRRADYWLLMNMTNKELQDIGISRGEINKVIYQDENQKEKYRQQSRELYKTRITQATV
tara:strand:- start:402 stop:623 length:222 start_codon:yes stop_codon:yes gene_type:complete